MQKEILMRETKNQFFAKKQETNFETNSCWKLMTTENKITYATHTHVECGACHTKPIVGLRWKCTKCTYDLCAACFDQKDSARSGSEHNKKHPFVKIKIPNTDYVPECERKQRETRLFSTGGKK